METATVQKETLWRNHNFLKLWTSDTISQFCSQFTGLTLPLTAFIILHSNPTEQEGLSFVAPSPWLLFGLCVVALVARDTGPRHTITAQHRAGRSARLVA